MTVDQLFVEDRDARRQLHASRACRCLRPALLHPAALSSRRHRTSRPRTQVGKPRSIYPATAFEQASTDLLQRLTDLDRPSFAVVLVPLLTDQLAPPRTCVEVEQPEHEPGEPEPALVQTHRRTQRLHRCRDKVLDLELARGHPDPGARVRWDLPRLDRSAEDRGEQRKDRRHRRVGVVLVQLREPLLDLDVAVEDPGERPGRPLGQQMVVQKGPVVLPHRHPRRPRGMPRPAGTRAVLRRGPAGHPPP